MYHSADFTVKRAADGTTKGGTAKNAKVARKGTQVNGAAHLAIFHHAGRP